MSRYRVERRSDFLEKWWSLGLWPDLYSVVQFMSVYDSDGIVRMRVWDVEQDEEVEYASLVAFHRRWNMTRRRKLESKVNWINDGF